MGIIQACLRTELTEDSKLDIVLKQGPLIKKGDYYHFRYFRLYPGKLEYFEIPLVTEELGRNEIKLLLDKKHLRGVMFLHQSSKTNYVFSDVFLKNQKLEIQLYGFSPQGQCLTWNLQARTRREFIQWIRTLHLAARPFWTVNTSSCSSCHELFNLCRRPHHCRKCGRCTCWECIPYFDKIPSLGYNYSVPVCRICSHIHLKESDLLVGNNVLVYGKYFGIINSFIEADSNKAKEKLVGITLSNIKRFSSCNEKFLSPTKMDIIVHPKFVDYPLDIVFAANIIKCAIRKHLAQNIFRLKLSWTIWNCLESKREQQIVHLMKDVAFAHDHESIKSLEELENLLISDDMYDSSLDTSYDEILLKFPLNHDLLLKLLEAFRLGVSLHPKYVYLLLQESREQISLLSTIQKIELHDDIKITIVGDLHGQLEDLLTIFDKNELPSKTNLYLFNGDYVDRGSHGVEITLIILAFKLVYPSYIYINRGNHECAALNQVFGFKEEVYQKYSKYSNSDFNGKILFHMFQRVFNVLPLCALINNKVFVTHGGLFEKDGVLLHDIEMIKRDREPPTNICDLEDMLFIDLLWSDPQTNNGLKPSSRGAGVEFGPDITKRFCKENDLNLIIRSHECIQDGVETTHDGFLLTVFSASSYCGSQTNYGAYVKLDATLRPDIHRYFSKSLQMVNIKIKNRMEKAQIMEKNAMSCLDEEICKNKTKLLTIFSKLDEGKTGKVSRLKWQMAMKIGLDLHLPFYYCNCLTGTKIHEMIDYSKFLDQYDQLNKVH